MTQGLKNTFTGFNFSNTNFNNQFLFTTNNLNTTKIWTQDTFTRQTSSMSYNSLQTKFYKKGLSFVNKINSDAEGNRRFSNNREEAWCADFVSTLAHETFGNKLPAGFPDARKHGVAVMSIKAWGEKHDRFLKVPNNNLGNFIAENVKPGDILILSRGGYKGHTAIVTKVNNDGSFETVDGNSGNKVKIHKRKALIAQGKQTLLGFVKMGDIA